MSVCASPAQGFQSKGGTVYDFSLYSWCLLQCVIFNHAFVYVRLTCTLLHLSWPHVADARLQRNLSYHADLQVQCIDMLLHCSRNKTAISSCIILICMTEQVMAQTQCKMKCACSNLFTQFTWSVCIHKARAIWQGALCTLQGLELDTVAVPRTLAMLCLLASANACWVTEAARELIPCMSAEAWSSKATTQT